MRRKRKRRRRRIVSSLSRSNNKQANYNNKFRSLKSNESRLKKCKILTDQECQLKVFVGVDDDDDDVMNQALKSKFASSLHLEKSSNKRWVQKNATNKTKRSVLAALVFASIFIVFFAVILLFIDQAECKHEKNERESALNELKKFDDASKKQTKLASKHEINDYDDGSLKAASLLEAQISPGKKTTGKF